MTNLVKKNPSEWDALQTWVTQDKNGFLKLEPKGNSHAEEIALCEKPRRFGRVWEIIRSFFGFSTLESVARRAISLAKETHDLSIKQKDALRSLAEKIKKFNNRPRWQHPVAIPNQVFKSLIDLSVQQIEKPIQHEVEKKAEEPVPPKAALHKKPIVRTRRAKKSAQPKQLATVQKKTLSPQKEPPSHPQKGSSSDVTAAELAQAEKDGAVNVPLAGKLHCSISEIFSSKNDKAAADLIDTAFTGCKIKGDGHCMFRSIALALLDKYAKNPTALLALIRRNIDSMKDGPYAISKPCQDSVERSLTALQQGTSIDEIICNRTLSNAWVLFLRYLAAHSLVSRGEDAINDAVTHMATDLDDKILIDNLHRLSNEVHMIRTGAKELEGSEETIDALAECQKTIACQYFSAKIDMSGADASYGTNLELVSLSRALGLTIVTLNFTLSAANRQFAYNSFPDNSFTSSDAPPPANDIFLLFRGNHYNALLHK